MVPMVLIVLNQTACIIFDAFALDTGNSSVDVLIVLCCLYTVAGSGDTRGARLGMRC